MQRWIKAVLAAGMMAMSIVSPVAAEPSVRPEVGRGWQEVVLSVSDIDRTAAFFIEFGGFEQREQGRLGADEMAAWGLDEAADGRFVLLAKPGEERGWVRLIEFSGVDRSLIRPGAQVWDQGGLFSIMVRSQSVDAAVDEAHARGWSVFNQPQVFEFEGLTIRNAVIRLPDGINLAVYERIAPPLEDWRGLEGFSYPFNTMAMVHDLARERAFFERGLGFSPFWAGDYIDPEPADTNFGLPHNLSTQVTRATAILQQAPGEDGRIELMAFEGLDGADFADRARAPNLGILSVRLPVGDLDASLQSALAAGGRMQAEPTDLSLGPYGAVRRASVSSPSGVIVELIEL